MLIRTHFTITTQGSRRAHNEVGFQGPSIINCFCINYFCKILHLKSLIAFWIRHWHHYLSYYYVAMFTVKIIFTAASFISLCLLSTFQTRITKINSLFVKLHFFFIIPDPGSLSLPFFQTLWNLNYRGFKSQKPQKHWLILKQIINADRYIAVCYLP